MEDDEEIKEMARKQPSLAELRERAVAAMAAHQQDMANDPQYRAAVKRRDKRSEARNAQSPMDRIS